MILARSRVHNIIEPLLYLARLGVYSYIFMLNMKIPAWGVKKCGANQKQHCKWAGVTKRFDIS